MLWLTLISGCSSGYHAAPVTGTAWIDPGTFDGDRALAEVADLVALGPRDAGTPGAERAARHLRDRLAELGVEARMDAFEEQAPGGLRTFRNVVGTLPGRDPGIIILGSHYDTKSGLDPGFQGANDSGSSSGVLLELARVIRLATMESGPAATVQFVFFDGEECRVRYGPHDGFHGSRYHAAALVEEGAADRVRAVIVLDMIGDRDLTVTLPRNSTPALLTEVLRAAADEGVRDRFSLSPYTIGDDHVAFLEAGMPAVDLIDFQFGSAPGRNDYWHTAEDRMERISAESLGAVGRVTLRLVNHLLGARAPTPPTP